MSNDRLKFRAWMYSPNGDYYMEYSSEGCISGFFEECGGQPIMQWTGLYGRDGVEIFEGDIVDHKNVSGAEEVYWNDKELCFACRGGVSESWLDSGYRAIGNIYENPELLDA